MRHPVPLIALVGAIVLSGPIAASPQVPIFRSGTDLVTVAATVRTPRGRPVTNLQATDFELYDSGVRRQILDFATEPLPLNVALLVDFSGSMDIAARRRATTDSVSQFLSMLTPAIDNVGLYVFDKGLHELQPLAPAPADVLTKLQQLAPPFGTTSLFDAIAETSRLLVKQAGPRRAVVALTDGADNASRLTASEVSGIASGIDVPVYVLVVVSPLDRFGKSTVDDGRLVDQFVNGPLGNLARWTGGEIYAGVGPDQSNRAAHNIVTALRQQYLIAFEPGPTPGWHSIELRAKDRDLVVRARSGYIVPNASIHR